MEFAYEVAVDAPLATTLTYAQPIGRDELLPVGCCVRVPLGRRKAVGYVLGPAVQAAADGVSFTIKPIEEILGQTPVFPEELIPFFRWIASYYHHPLGEVLRTALPLHATTRGESRVREKLQATLLPGPKLEALLHQGHDQEALVAVLQQDGSLSLKKAEIKALNFFLGEFFSKNQQSIPSAQINRLYGGAGPRIKRLIDLDILQATQERIFRDPFGDPPTIFPEPETLTNEQTQVLAQLIPAIEQETFSPFLLFGVTGCGKTEVYLQAVQRTLQQGKTAMVLVPEIALASQLEAHFFSRFGDDLAVLHSGLADGERLDQWQRVLQGSARVVLGARSAIFAPLTQLGLVVVDEEHEPAYKQEDGLRYNGRDLAVLRAQMAGCPVLLGSATPSVISYHHCKEKKYQLLTMRHRVANQPLPRVEIVDLTQTQRSRPDLSFSDPLINALSDTLEMGKQSLLFVNRRGFASSMLCRDCGAIVQCAHCQVSLTLHRSRNILLCHYCGYSRHPQALCPACGSTRIKGIGMGSERIEEEVQQLFPQARVARLDSDTTAIRKHYLATLKAVREGKVDILIGTQMIAKGLHFPGIRLVGVVWADSGLSMPDYKAAERTFSLLSQVTGRAGRGKDSGEVIIQTYQPHHYAIQLAQQHDYPSFFAREITVRAPLAYPPFSRLVNLRFSATREEQVQKAAAQVAEFIRRHKWASAIDLLGPTPAPLVKIKDKIRYQLLLKSKNQQVLHAVCDELLEKKRQLCASSVSLSLDVDPENMM
ncbi:MAG: primosomal protein N' [Desulfobulbus sp.]|nr:primosomal protein N' [Desulfobulbus sp.]